MNVGGDAADQLVREGIQITESATKLAALGAKNLAALLLALLKEGNISGKTRLARIIKEGDVQVFPLKTADLERFFAEAKRYGVLYTVVRDKGDPDGTCDVITRGCDVSKINRIFERFGYPAPVKEGVAKKAEARVPSGPNSTERGNGLTASGRERTDEAASGPVHAKLAALRRAGQGIDAPKPEIIGPELKTKGLFR